MTETPSQTELRRRLKAARVLADLTIAELCERLPKESRVSERTMRKYEGGETQLRPPVLRELAAALGVPYQWFTVPDLTAHLAPAPDQHEVAQFEARLRWLERQLGREDPSDPDGSTTGEGSEDKTRSRPAEPHPS